MKKFKNVNTGVIYTVTNEKLLSQYNNKELYEEIGVKGKSKVEVHNAEETKTPNVEIGKKEEPTNKELMEILDEMGVDYSKKSNKAELQKLITDNQN